MGYTGITTKIVALCSIGLAGASGVQTVRVLTSPPLIEGTGVYESPVSAGDTVMIDWTITKRTDCPGELSRVWHGENGFYMVEPLRKSALPTINSPVTYSIQTEIPTFAPVGNLQLSINGVYNCDNGPMPFSLGPVEIEVLE